MSRLTAAATVTGELLLRPPLRSLRLDVTLTASALVWALLPDRTAAAPRVDAAPERIEVYELAGATVLALRGEQWGGYALLVPAGDPVVLRDLPIAHWGEPPEALELVVISAAGLRVEGLRFDPSTTPGAQVDASPLQDQRAVLQTLGGMSGPPIDLSWADPQATALTLRPAVSG